MPHTITLHDKTFVPYLAADAVQELVDDLGKAIQFDYAGKKPLFITLLKGSFMFASDLIRRLDLDCEIEFVQLASYHGTVSTGGLKEESTLRADVQGRHVIVLEDIVDTGNTLAKYLPQLEAGLPASLAVATLLLKPNALQHQLPLEYVGKEIPNDFVVGYGMDYDELGRGLPGIWVVD